jgi:hypothetical protein
LLHTGRQISRGTRRSQDVLTSGHDGWTALSVVRPWSTGAPAGVGSVHLTLHFVLVTPMADASGFIPDGLPLRVC